MQHERWAVAVAVLLLWLLANCQGPLSAETAVEVDAASPLPLMSEPERSPFFPSLSVLWISFHYGKNGTILSGIGTDRRHRPARRRCDLLVRAGADGVRRVRGGGRLCEKIAWKSTKAAETLEPIKAE